MPSHSDKGEGVSKLHVSSCKSPNCIHKDFHLIADLLSKIVNLPKLSDWGSELPHQGSEERAHIQLLNKCIASL